MVHAAISSGVNAVCARGVWLQYHADADEQFAETVFDGLWPSRQRARFFRRRFFPLSPPFIVASPKRPFGHFRGDGPKIFVAMRFKNA